MGSSLFLRLAQAQEKILLALTAGNSGKLRGWKSHHCLLLGNLEVALNVENLEILTLHLSIISRVYFLRWMQCETLAQRHKM